MRQTSQQKWNKWMSKTERIFRTLEKSQNTNTNRCTKGTCRAKKKAALQDKVRLNAVESYLWYNFDII